MVRLVTNKEASDILTGEKNRPKTTDELEKQLKTARLVLGISLLVIVMAFIEIMLFKTNMLAIPSGIGVLVMIISLVEIRKLLKWKNDFREDG